MSEQFKNAKKEVELLLKMEGGVSPKDIERQKKRMTQKVQDAGEAAGRVGEVQNAQGAYLAGMTDEDIEVGTGLMPTADDIMRSYAEKSGLPFKELKEYNLGDEDKMKRLTSYLLSTTARERRVFPVDERVEPGKRPVLTVAIADPLDITVGDDLRLMLPEHDVELVVAAEDDIIHAIDKIYGVGEEDLDSIIEALNVEESSQATTLGRGSEVEINLENNPPLRRPFIPPVIPVVSGPSSMDRRCG